ncbi:Clp protease N-terminal domain-containing protein [Amycolatopsis sp. YIM 10]|uniref:Clp protease N-terminal domain-containing protein n=1 Tax=Amycolatopsis sp. YIM 10 TaxID=2653857 RepID=UPI0012A9B9A1|nr:Clp protease N-terminal domain-containing protein [Amycolatopsis sp. YIM 10]QFU92582.1 Clp amino terminal domain protein [Amycolatopsis sp. YIM 10]
MMTAFDTYLHAIIARAEHEARDDGASTIEAQHLLLAIAVDREAGTHEILTSAGVDYRAIRDALDREFDYSLSTVGVSRAAFDFPRPTADSGQPKMGASAKLALERSVASVAHKKDLRPAHLLLGVLRAEVGTVPRALAMAGIDQVALRERVLRALTSEGE